MSGSARSGLVPDIFGNRAITFTRCSCAAYILQPAFSWQFSSETKERLEKKIWPTRWTPQLLLRGNWITRWVSACQNNGNGNSPLKPVEVLKLVFLTLAMTITEIIGDDDILRGSPRRLSSRCRRFHITGQLSSSSSGTRNGLECPMISRRMAVRNRYRKCFSRLKRVNRGDSYAFFGNDPV